MINENDENQNKPSSDSIRHGCSDIRLRRVVNGRSFSLEYKTSKPPDESLNKAYDILFMEIMKNSV